MTQEVAVVTGAGGGLGLSLSRRLAQDQFHVCVADVSQESSDETVRILTSEGFSASSHAVDVADERAMTQLGETADAIGRLTAWVNNAGITRRIPVLDESLEGWHRVMSVNATGTFLGTRTAGRIMRERGSGSIVNISSICAQRAMTNTSSYGASKAAILGLTIHAALELAPFGVRVNAVLPGTIATSMNAERLADPDEAAWSAERIPVGRPGMPDEVAGLVSFLCDPDSAYVNGAAIPCDGGWASHA